MIEEMANKAGGPVVLIAHSMGNMYTLYFLNQQPQAWKDRYIKAFVSLGPPWAGVGKTLRVMATGMGQMFCGKFFFIFYEFVGQWCGSHFCCIKLYKINYNLIHIYSRLNTALISEL